MVLLRPRTSSDLTARVRVHWWISANTNNLTKTNAYQRDQRQTNRIPKEISVTPHALKMPEQAQAEIGAANQAHESQRPAAAIMVTTALRAVEAAPLSTMRRGHFLSSERIELKRAA